MELEIFITIVGSVLASSGFWAFIQTKRDSKDVKTQMLIGLGHDRLTHLAMCYISRGDWITQDEYENLHKYLYEPYVKIGGNGSVTRLMNEIEMLRVVKQTYVDKEKEIC